MNTTPNPSEAWTPIQPKKNRHIGRWVLIGVLVVIIISAIAGAAGGGNKSSSTKATTAPTLPSDKNLFGGSSDHPASQDLGTPGTDWQCTTDEAGFMTAKGTLTNHSSGRSNYVIQVSFLDKASGTQIATGSAFVNNVEANQGAEWEANSLHDAPAAAATCKITDVSRFAS